MSTSRLLALTLIAGAVCLPAAADSPAPAGIAACKACHGPQGVSINPTIPNLAGQKPLYIEKQLTAFKAGERKNDLMHAIASQLGEDDIKAYAAFWAAQPATPPEAAHAGATPATPAPAIPSRMALPANFPAGFTVYQDLPPEDDSGPTKRYANTIALKAAKAGKPLPTGSVIVTESHDKDGKISGYAAMEVRTGWGNDVPVLLRNGDWDYALMGPDKKTRTINQAQCLACHKPMETDSYVFTFKDLKAAAAKI